MQREGLDHLMAERMQDEDKRRLEQARNRNLPAAPNRAVVQNRAGRPNQAPAPRPASKGDRVQTRFSGLT